MFLLKTFWIEHMDEVAEQFGARPDLPSMFFKDPGLALRCFLGPCLPAQYRLQGPKPWPHAAAYIKDVRARSNKRPHTTRDPDRDPNNGRQSSPEVGERAARTSSQDKADGDPSNGPELGGIGRSSACTAFSAASVTTPKTSLRWRWSWTSVLYYVYLVVMSVCCAFWLGSAVLGKKAKFRGDV